MLSSRAGALGMTGKEDMERIRKPQPWDSGMLCGRRPSTFLSNYGNRETKAALFCSLIPEWQSGYHAQEMPPLLCQQHEKDQAGEDQHPAPSGQLLPRSQLCSIACSLKAGGPKFPAPRDRPANTTGQQS